MPLNVNVELFCLCNEELMLIFVSKLYTVRNQCLFQCRHCIFIQSNFIFIVKIPSTSFLNSLHGFCHTCLVAGLGGSVGCASDW